MENIELKMFKLKETVKRNETLSKLDKELVNSDKATTLRFVAAYETGRIAILKELLKK